MKDFVNELKWYEEPFVMIFATSAAIGVGSLCLGIILETFGIYFEILAVLCGIGITGVFLVGPILIVAQLGLNDFRERRDQDEAQ